MFGFLSQPPSGGCVLKQQIVMEMAQKAEQPPSGGCVLKHEVKSKLKAHTGSSHLRVAVC